MKTKNLLYAMLMAPAIFTACSNEDFVDQAAQKGEAIPGKDVVLVFQNDANTRMDYTPGTENADGTWNPSAYKWELPAAAPTSANAVDPIGLCRIIGNVTTSNSLFFPTAVISAGQQDWVTAVSSKGTGAKFKTENLTLYAGKYVAYYPYNEELVNDGPVKMSLKQAQVQSNANNVEHVAANGFSISDIIELEGGKQVDKNFGLQPLYSTVYIRLKGNVSNLISVSLESDNEIFPVEATLDVTKLASKKASELTAADLTVTKKVNHIDLTLTTAATLTAGDYQTFYMNLMPGTYTGVRVVYRTQTGYKVEALAGSFTTKPGQFFDLTRTLDGSSFSNYQPTDNIIVNDAASWANALTAVATVSNTTRTIVVNAPIELDNTNSLFKTIVDASSTGKVIVKGESITVPSNALGSAKFQNVIFENKVILGKAAAKTDLTIPAGASVTFNDLVGITDNNAAESAITVTGQASTATVLNLKNATIPGTITIGLATASTLATLNIIDGGILTTSGVVDFSGTSTDNVINVAKGATWNIAKGNVLGTNEGTLNVAGTLNINDGTFSLVNAKGACDFTNGTVVINGGSFEIGDGAALKVKGSTPGDVAGTITNKGGIVYVQNGDFNTWATNKSASFTNNGGEYYVMGFTNNAALTAAMAAATTTYKQATGFELKPAAAETWTLTNENTTFAYDLLFNATSATITLTIPDNATCTVNGDIIINGTTNLVKITKTAGESKNSVFKAKNVTVGAKGKLQVGDAANDADFKMQCNSVYVNSGAEFGYASNVTGCVPTGDGTINK